MTRHASRELRIARARFADLAALRRFVRDACAEAQAPADVRDSLELAVDEACTNIVEHGYDNDDPGPLMVEFETRGDEFRVSIADRGTPFPPERAPPANTEARASGRSPGGLGWHFIRSVVDTLHYDTRADGTNQLILVKRRA